MFNKLLGLDILRILTNIPEPRLQMFRLSNKIGIFI